MDVKKELNIGFLLIIFVLGLLVFYLFQYNQQISLSSKNTTVPAGNLGSTLKLSSEELAKHSNPNDCWIVLDNKVLKISPYLKFHPAGEEVITKYCGQDATIAFNTIKDEKGHSAQAINLLMRFTLGIIGKSVDKSIINRPVSTSDL